MADAVAGIGEHVRFDGLRHCIPGMQAHRPVHVGDGVVLKDGGRRVIEADAVAPGVGIAGVADLAVGKRRRGIAAADDRCTLPVACIPDLAVAQRAGAAVLELDAVPPGRHLVAV